MTDPVLAVRAAVTDGLGGYLALLETMVGIDSRSDHPHGIEAVQRIVADRLAPLGAGAQWRTEGGVAHLRVTLPGGRRRVVLLGHADTVVPESTPFRRVGNRAQGPGVADMKGGLVVALAAAEQLAALGAARPAIDVVVVGDEETRTTPPPFLDDIRGADACLVLECGRPGGGFVVARKTGFWARVVAEGRSAHSGTEPERGSNALLALCREVLRIAELDGARSDLSVSLGRLAGGTAVNAVPDRATASFDMRSHDPAHLQWAVDAAGRFGDHPGVALRIEGDQAWPALLPEAGRTLAGTYEALAAAAGIPAFGLATGGMSDGCWASAAGVPTIDGLGPIGGSDHSPDEFVEIDSIPDRAGLLAGVLCAIEHDEIGGGE